MINMDNTILRKPVSQWSDSKSLAMLSAAWLAASLFNVLLALGAYLALAPLIREAIAGQLHALLPATVAVPVLTLWIAALSASRHATRDKREPNDALIVATPVWMLFAAAGLQIGLLLWISLRIALPPIIAVNAALTIGPMTALIDGWALPHLRHRIPPYLADRPDNPAGGDARR